MTVYLKRFYKASKNPRIEYDSFHNNRQFVAAWKKITEMRVPVVLIQLPVVADLENGEYQMTQRKSVLLESFEDVTGLSVRRVAEGLKLGENDIEKLFLLPWDSHPSTGAMQLYADMVEPFVPGHPK